MESKELLRLNLVTCHGMVSQLIEGLREDPLTFPTLNGGCHPMWVMGNLALGDAVFLHEWILGGDNPLADWTGMFGVGTEATANVADYPSFDEVVNKANEMHRAMLATLDSFTEEDLDKSSKAPSEYAPFFGTNRKIFHMSGLHWMMHRGHLTDVRRAAGRERMGP